MNMRAFVQQYPYPELAKAVIRQLGGWQEFKQSAIDIANHGIDGGFHGFIYTVDTVKFARKNLDVIMGLAKDMARDLGEPSAYNLIAGFVCLRDDKLTPEALAEAIHSRHAHESRANILNALAWFAGEEVSRAYADRA